MKVIVLTGGIGAGKSFVLKYIYSKWKFDIIYTDNVAKSLMRNGESAYFEIVKKFGKNILDEKLEIDSIKLGKIVFSDENKLKELNNLIHPIVKKEVLKIINNSKSKIVFIETAIAIESKFNELGDELWYVYSEEEVRTNRLIKERCMSREKAKSIISSQLSYDDIKKYIDVTLYNDGSDSVFSDIDINIERLLKNAIL